MAYVLGYLYADGSLEDASYIRGKYIRVVSTDLSSIQVIKQLLGSEHKIIERLVVAPRKKLYVLRIGDHCLYDSLARRGLHPRKSLTMRLPLVPNKYWGDFVRGYFDGDGCIHLEKGKTGKIKRLATVFTSGSKQFLLQLARRLNRFGLQKMKVYTSRRSFQLRFSTRDSIKLYELMYANASTVYLPRKYGLFLVYFKLPKRRYIMPNGAAKLGPVAKKSTRRSAKPLYGSANLPWAS